MAENRLTQTYTEIVADGAARVALTQAYAEVITDGTPRLRVSQVYAEVVVAVVETAFLVLYALGVPDAVVVRVAVPSVTPVEEADRARAVDGSMHVTFSPVAGGRKRTWSVRTVPLPADEAATLRSALASPLVTADGTWVERPVTVCPVAAAETPVRGDLSVLTFTLEEA